MVELDCVEEGIHAKREGIMIIHSQLDPANCNSLAKDDLSAGGIRYILRGSDFIRLRHSHFLRRCDSPGGTTPRFLVVQNRYRWI